MEPDTRAQQQVSAEVPMEPPGSSAPVEVQARSAEEAAHSENNILQWKAYLPKDCIRTMIEMGWDITT
jgi:hypothetical protein